MFTGIIQSIGKINNIHDAKFCFSVAATEFLTEVKIGHSIAVNGVCLTVIEVGVDYFKADLSQETLRHSIFSALKIGSRVNLEKSLRLSQGIDGHLVSGHVDGIAKVVEKFSEGDSTRFKISTPQNLVKYIAKKGAVCINGVSLTVNEVAIDIFDINIVPHTLLSTTLGELSVGSKVNLEVDMIARHLEQLLKGQLNESHD